MADDDARRQIQRVLCRPLQLVCVITIGKTLVGVAVFDRNPFGKILLEVDAGGRNANAVLHQLGGVAKDFSGQGDDDAAIQ